MRIVILLFILGNLISCSRNGASNTGSLSIHFSDINAKKILREASSNSTSTFVAWGSQAISEFASADCLAVWISRNETTANRCISEDGIDYNISQLVGFVSKSNQIEISNVPTGLGEVVLTAVQSTNGKCPDVLNLDTSLISQPMIVASESINIVAGENTVNLQAKDSGELIKFCEGNLFGSFRQPSRRIPCDQVSGTNASSFESDQIRVYLKFDQEMSAWSAEYGLSLVRPWAAIKAADLQFGGLSRELLASKLCKDNRVHMVEGVTLGFSDPGYPSMYQATGSNSEPLVAVISTGIDATHSVFSGSGAMWFNSADSSANGIDDDGNGFIDDTNAWNFVLNSNLTTDPDGAGTHSAGVVLNKDFDITTTPVAANIQIMPIVHLDNMGVGTDVGAVKALSYAIQNNADVILIEYGSAFESHLIRRSLELASNRGISIVIPAGNSATNIDQSPFYPSNWAIPNVISVAAYASSALASFSNFGPLNVDLAEDGIDVLSTTLSNSFANSSGTSPAAAGVAGTMAQLKRAAPGLSGYQLKEILFSNVSLEASLSGIVRTGGRLNQSAASAAATAAAANPYFQPILD